jgi:hypothetical protein
MTKIEHGVTAKATLVWAASPSPSPTAQYSFLAEQAAAKESWRDSLSAEEPMEQKTSVRRSRFDQYFLPKSSTSNSPVTSSSKHTLFDIIRHRLPAAISLSDRPAERQYTLKPEADPDSPVECIVMCPDWVDVNGPERSLKIVLRLRAKRAPDWTADGDADPLNIREPAPSAGSSSSSAAAGPSSQSGSASKVDKAEDIYTHVLELGMEVEEVERFS